MEYLFSYGTLQLPEVQTAIFGALIKGRKDYLIGFREERVEITNPKVLALSGERFHPILIKTSNPENRIEGQCFALTAEQLIQADEYEVEDYHRIAVTLESGRTAWLYVAKE